MDVDLSTNSWMQIANAALAQISADILSTFNDGSLTATYVTTLLPTALDEVYGTLPLDDISLYANLARNGSYKPESSGYTYSYIIPPKCAFVREVVVEPEGTDWKRVRGAILTNASAVRVRYVQKPSTPNDMPPYCRSLLITLLASKLAGALNHDASLSSTLLSQYQSQLSQFLVLREAPGAQPTYREVEAWV